MIAKAFQTVIAVTLLFLVLVINPANVFSATPVEHQVKAAFINSFIKFIDWPESAKVDNVITISILGDTPLVEALKTIEEMPAKGRRLTVRTIKSLQELGNSNILFLASSEKKRVDEVLRALKNSNVLTIGETEGFCRRGGTINFVLSENKVHFEINVDSAKEAGLAISSKLLKLATIVPTAQEGN